VVLERAEDIDSVFQALRRIAQRGFFTKERAQRDVAEEVGYQLLVHPEWIRPHVADLITEGIGQTLDFNGLCLLLENAPDVLVGKLIAGARQAQDQIAVWLLLATRAPAAMEAVSALASANVGAVARECRAFGFHLPASGPAQPRFKVERQALQLLPGTQARGAPHAVGLPVEDIVAPHEARIVFRYLSMTPALVSGLPNWSGQAHLIAPRHWPPWTLIARASDDGRLEVLEVELAADRSLDEELPDHLDEAAAIPQTISAVAVVPFDDELLYVNQHPFLTPGVIGVVGGPPMGLAPAPTCPNCRRLMFHIAYIETSVLKYGDGFRSLFLCEDCHTSSTLATLWN
jgi:hypothetical protein